MKKIISIFALLFCIVSVQGQRQPQSQQSNQGDYEFILPQKPNLNMEYPEDANIPNTVQTYKALSYDGTYAFIYNEKHCGYYPVPTELRSGFSSSVRNLQKENSSLYWKRVKEIMDNINKYWAEHGSSISQQKSDISYEPNTSRNNYGQSSGKKVYDIVEQMPSFPGGMGALMQYLSSHLKYPVIAEKNGTQGRVICTFVVEKDGNIADVKVSRSVDPSLDKEAVRVISGMPKWIPGKHNGKECRVKFTLPVTFKL